MPKALQGNNSEAIIRILHSNELYFEITSYWFHLSDKPDAIQLLEANQDEIDWDELSLNPNAIHLLEVNQDEINWDELSENPSIFTYDYEQMTKNKLELNRELIEWFWHPTRVRMYLNEESDLLY